MIHVVLWFLFLNHFNICILTLPLHIMTLIAVIVFSLMNTSLRMVENAESYRRFIPRLCVIVSSCSVVIVCYCIQL